MYDTTLDPISPDFDPRSWGPQSRPVCGAQDGHGHTCTLDPHPEGTRHLDVGAGSRYHSVSWR